MVKVGKVEAPRKVFWPFNLKARFGFVYSKVCVQWKLLPASRIFRYWYHLAPNVVLPKLIIKTCWNVSPKYCTHINVSIQCRGYVRKWPTSRGAHNQQQNFHQTTNKVSIQYVKSVNPRLVFHFSTWKLGFSTKFHHVCYNKEHDIRNILIWGCDKIMSIKNYFLFCVCLEQLCPTRGPRAACGPVEGFVRPSLSFCCSKSILCTDNLSLFWQFWV